MKHLILLHGALGHPGYFDFIKESLSEHFVIHTPVFDGHADSGWQVKELTMETYVHQIREYCESNALERVSVFGYSMGGYVGLCYASQFPEQVEAIMTLATKLEWTPEIAEKEAKMLDPVIIRKKVPKFAGYLSDIHGSQNWENLTHAIACILKDLGNNPLLNVDALSAIVANAQLMVGDKDNMVSIEETRAASQRIRKANFAVLPDTIHPFEKINQKLILRLMKDFFIEV